MSLALNVGRINAVLLNNGVWYDVVGDSFCTDAYEFVEDYGSRHEVVLGGGQDEHITAAGFFFTTTGGTEMAGPMTAIQAVRMNAVGREAE